MDDLTRYRRSSPSFLGIGTAFLVLFMAMGSRPVYAQATMEALDVEDVPLMTQYQKRDLAREAHELYFKGDYLQAAEIYQALIDAGLDYPAFHYNAGNAWYNAGDTGLAVWHYEKALRQIPRDENLQRNLRQVSPPENFREPFILLLLFTTFAGFFALEETLHILAVAWWTALLLFSVATLLRRAGRPRRLIMRLGQMVMVVFLIFAFTAAAKAYHQSRPWAILVGEAPEAFIAPREDAGPVYDTPPQAGWKVLRLSILPDGWAQVRMPDGTPAFVRQSALRSL